MQQVRLGIPYFLRTRSVDHFRRDLEEIVAVGATYVVLIVTDFDMRYFPDTIAGMVQAAKDAGLSVQVDPWGLGGIFCTPYSVFPVHHAEACQVTSDGVPLGRGCPTHPTLHAFIEKWIDHAATLGADGIFWDEPQLLLEERDGQLRWACRCSHCQALFGERWRKPMPRDLTQEVIDFRQEALLQLLTRAMRRAREHGLENTLCLLPREDPKHGFGDWGAVAALPDLDSLGTDPYWTVAPRNDVEKRRAFDQRIRYYAEKVRTLAEAAGKRSHFWVLGFRIAKGAEHDMERAALLAWEAGIRDLAIWADKFGCGDNNRSEDPEAVWAMTRRIFQSWRERG